MDLFEFLVYVQVSVKFDFCLKTEEVKSAFANLIDGNILTPTYTVGLFGNQYDNGKNKRERDPIKAHQMYWSGTGRYWYCRESVSITEHILSFLSG